MSESSKRKADGDHNTDRAQPRAKKQWRVPHKGETPVTRQPRTINPGDKGIWATCTKVKERKASFELLDLFNEYAQELYGDVLSAASTGGEDIEDEISRELKDLKGSKTSQQFEVIMPDMLCVLFIRCVDPIDPVHLVQKIAIDAAAEPHRKRTRFTARLSPMTIMERASEEGLRKACEVALQPVFHAEDAVARKFAIRPSIRNHSVLKRDAVIKLVADAVTGDGSRGHSVDLKGYDSCILVEIYQNICGISVVDDKFEKLKRYNLSELFEPSAKERDGKAVVGVDDQKTGDGKDQAA